MGVLADLVPRAQPALFGAGVDGSATEGATWDFGFVDVTDDAGAPINLTGVTGTCKILATDLTTIIATLTFTGASDGSFDVSLDEATTAGLAGGASIPRKCNWYLKLSDGTDVVQAWAPSSSAFAIYPAGA